MRAALLQVTDADVIKFLRMLTFLPLDEVDALEQAMSQPDYVPNTAQKRLAEAVTRWAALAGSAGHRALVLGAFAQLCRWWTL